LSHRFDGFFSCLRTTIPNPLKPTSDNLLLTGFFTVIFSLSQVGANRLFSTTSGKSFFRFFFCWGPPFPPARFRTRRFLFTRKGRHSALLCFGVFCQFPFQIVFDSTPLFFFPPFFSLTHVVLVTPCPPFFYLGYAEAASFSFTPRRLKDLLVFCKVRGRLYFSHLLVVEILLGTRHIVMRPFRRRPGLRLLYRRSAFFLKVGSPSRKKCPSPLSRFFFFFFF